ncbi:MAG: DUF4124 domain-containing protein [bacterium]|nr:DUF4124 domain-containing protein [bacterium]
MRQIAKVSLQLLAICALAAPVHADLYQWVDADGKLHFTDDPTTVPRDYRKDARREDPSSMRKGGWNTLKIELPKPATSMRSAPPHSRSAKAGKKHVIGVQRGANEIRLIARLDGNVDAHFIADTGASINTMPLSVAKQLDIEIGFDTPRINVVGVGGKPIEAPLVRIDSIQVGSAIVRNIEIVVLDTMSTGLLGMPFFNHFKVEIDPSVGTLTLTELQGSDGAPSGRDRAAWRQRYRQLHRRQDAVEEQREKVLPEYATASEPFLERLELAEQQIEEELANLDDEAARAGIPASWRE